MKTNLPGDFDQLAQAAIDDVATDAQLEALESAIMERSDGADVLRDIAERQAITVVQTAPSKKRRMPLLAKVLLFGSVTAAAAVVALMGASVLYFSFSSGSAYKQQVVQTPVAPVTVDVSNEENPLEGEFPMTTAVPEPSASLLFLSGTTLLLFRRRRSSKT